MNQSEDNRWWIDRGPRRGKENPPHASIAIGGASYDELRDYDQEKVRTNLSNINIKLLEEINPAPQSWHYLSMKPEQGLLQDFERLKRACPLPEPLRGVAVDCGHSLGILITGEPLGAKILEVHLTETPSLDFWEQGNLVREGLFSTWEETMEVIQSYIPILMLPPHVEILG
jgi:hypothetical protein